MKSGSAIGLIMMALAVAWSLSAQPSTVSSRSGQFFVTGPGVLGTALRAVELDSPRVTLDPALLAVSCERIKAALLGQMETTDQWQGRILATIDPTLMDPQAIVLQAKRYADAWQYRMRFPVEVDRRHLIRTVVEMLLLEMGNRRSQSRPVDLPPWLAAGLTSIMQSSTLANLTIDPQTTQFSRVSSKDPLAEVKQVLTTRPPLTLDELNWPTEEPAADYQDKVHEMCAHLMVSELLRLPGGPACLERFLAFLPDYRNWQLAFFRAYHEYFPDMMAWDKWWSLLLVNIANRDLYVAWSPEESWAKFEEILATPVQVHVREQELPMTAQASLQSIIQEWENRRQISVLTLKLNHLNALRVRAAQEIVGLVDDYREVLREYLEQRTRPGMARRLLPGLNDAMVQQTVGRLNELDQRKETVRRLLEVAKTNRLSQAP